MGLPSQEMTTFTNRALDRVGAAQRAVKKSATLNVIELFSGERLITNQRGLYLATTAAIAARMVKVAKGTMLLRWTMTEFMRFKGSSCDLDILHPGFLMVIPLG